MNIVRPYPGLEIRGGRASGGQSGGQWTSEQRQGKRVQAAGPKKAEWKKWAQILAKSVLDIGAPLIARGSALADVLVAVNDVWDCDESVFFPDSLEERRGLKELVVGLLSAGSLPALSDFFPSVAKTAVLLGLDLFDREHELADEGTSTLSSMIKASARAMAVGNSLVDGLRWRLEEDTALFHMETSHDPLVLLQVFISTFVRWSSDPDEDVRSIVRRWAILGASLGLWEDASIGWWNIGVDAPRVEDAPWLQALFGRTMGNGLSLDGMELPRFWRRPGGARRWARSGQWLAEETSGVERKIHIRAAPQGPEDDAASTMKSEIVEDDPWDPNPEASLPSAVAVGEAAREQGWIELVPLQGMVIGPDGYGELLSGNVWMGPKREETDRVRVEFTVHLRLPKGVPCPHVGGCEIDNESSCRQQRLALRLWQWPRSHSTEVPSAEEIVNGERAASPKSSAEGTTTTRETIKTSPMHFGSLVDMIAGRGVVAGTGAGQDDKDKSIKSKKKKARRGSVVSLASRSSSTSKSSGGSRSSWSKKSASLVVEKWRQRKNHVVKTFGSGAPGALHRMWGAQAPAHRRGKALGQSLVQSRSSFASLMSSRGSRGRGFSDPNDGLEDFGRDEGGEGDGADGEVDHGVSWDIGMMIGWREEVVLSEGWPMITWCIAGEGIDCPVLVERIAVREVHSVPGPPSEAGGEWCDDEDYYYHDGASRGTRPSWGQRSDDDVGVAMASTEAIRPLERSVNEDFQEDDDVCLVEEVSVVESWVDGIVEDALRTYEEEG